MQWGGKGKYEDTKQALIQIKKDINIILQEENMTNDGLMATKLHILLVSKYVKQFLKLQDANKKYFFYFGHLAKGFN